MSIGILPIGQSKTISDGIVLKKFMDYDCVAIAQGNFIKFFKLDEGKIYIECEFKIYGEVSNLVEMTYLNSKNSNLLILLTDGRYSVIHYENSEFITRQTGFYLSSVGPRLYPPYKISQNDYQIFMQLTTTSLQYFEVTKDLYLSNPTQIPIPCLRIHDFTYVQINSTSVKLAVLIETIKHEKQIKFFILDSKTNNFEETSSLIVDDDAYKIFPMPGQSIIAFTTNKIIKCKEKTSETITMTIYTSDPISKLVQLTEDISVAIDTKGNTYSLFFPLQGTPLWQRVGQANNPTHLSIIDENTCFSFSQNGPSHIIEMTSSEYANITEVYRTYSGPMKIIPVDPSNESDLFSISDDGSINIIRKLIPIRENIKLGLNSCYKSWFFDQNSILLSYEDCTNLISYSTRSIEVIDDHSIISDEKTIAFIKCNDSFIQITPSSINFGGKRTKIGFQLLCAYTSPNYIGIYTDNGVFSSYSTADRNIQKKPYFSKRISHNDFAPNRIACSEHYVACSYWATKQVVLTKIRNMKTTVFDYKGIDIAFDSNENLLILDEKDLIQKIITHEKVVQTIHCESSHSHFIPLDNSIIVAGRYPCLIVGDSLFSIETSQPALHADIFGNQILYMTDSSLIISQSMPQRTSVLQRQPAISGIYDCTNISKGKYCIAYIKQPEKDHEESTYYIASVDSPLDSPENPLQVDGKISCMTGFSVDDKCLIALCINDSIQICECEDDSLQLRCKQAYKGKFPFHIEYFNSYLLVAYSEEIALFSVECVSATIVQLHKLLAHPTLDGFGEATAIATYNDQIAVGDAIESIVVYKLDNSVSPPKFQEIGRNLDKVYVSKIAFVEDRIFVGDTFGNIHYMEFTDTKNYVSKDIARTNSYHVGSMITSVYSCHLSARVFFGTESSNHFLITPITDDRLSILIDTATPYLKSVGNHIPKMMTTVVEKCIQLPNIVFKNLGILQDIETMKKSDIELIAKECEMDPSEVIMLINYCFETN